MASTTANTASITPSAADMFAPAASAHTPVSVRTTRTGRRRVSRLGAALALRAADVLGLASVFVAAALAVDGPVSAMPLSDAAGWLITPALAAVFLKSTGAYHVERAQPRRSQAARVALAFALTVLCVEFGAFLLGAPRQSTAAWFGALAVAGGGVLALHLAAASLLDRLRRAGRFAERVVIVGATQLAERLIATNAKSGDVNVLGVFDDRYTRRPDTIAGAPVLGDLEALFAWPGLPEADRILVTVSDAENDRVRDILARLAVLPNPVALILDLDGVAARDASLGDIAALPLADLANPVSQERRALVKRASDFILGGAALIAALPFMAIIALLVRLDSPGPALFRQRRHGFNNEIIDVLKFRTMRHTPADRAPMRQVIAADPRVTRLGRFLRRTSLDELPQLWNVLKGDMSLVGPRPHAVDMRTGDADTASLIWGYAHRHRVKPGLTGWAQVNGSRGPLHSPDAVRERIEYDLDYVARSSFWLDLAIMARTPMVLLGDRVNVR